MNTQQAITARRSIRKFGNAPVPRAQLEQILQAGAAAPSAKNRQPWHFTVATGGAKAELLAVMAQGIAREKQAPLLPGNGQHIPGAEHTLAIMASTPAVILVTNPLEESLQLPATMEELFFCLANAQSVGAAIENMSLAAVDLGLGSLWICDVFFAYPEICRWLGGDRRLLAALAVGSPAQQPYPRPRRPMADTVEWRP